MSLSPSHQHTQPATDTTASMSGGGDSGSGGPPAAAAPTAPPKPTQPPAYRLVAADEMGVLRVIEVPAGPKWDEAAVVAKWGEANKERAVCSLACSVAALTPGGAAVVAVGRKGRRLDILDAQTGAQQASLALPAGAAAQQAGARSSSSSQQAAATVAAVAFVPATADRPLQLVAGTSDGMVCICSCSSSSDSSGWSVTSSFPVGPNLVCLAVDGAGSHIVVGGEGMQPGIWDLSSGTRVWQGKGGKPNRVGLVDKAFTTALAFLPAGGDAAAAATADGGGSSSIARRFVAGTACAKLQLYDTSAGRRPQKQVVFGETRITSVAPEANGERVWAANGTGHMQLLLLSTHSLQDALKGAGGSVRGLALHPDGSEGLVASAGLDRFLRIYSTSSRASRARVYLKQQLSAVAWLPVPPAAEAAAAAAEADAGAQAGACAAPGAAAAKPRSKGRSRSKAAAARGGDEEAAVAAKRRKSAVRGPGVDV